MNLGASEQFSRAVVQALKDARTATGMSQAKLAELSGVSRAMINHLESGKRNPTLIVAHALARSLKTTMAEIVVAAEGRKGGHGTKR